VCPREPEAEEETMKQTWRGWDISRSSSTFVSGLLTHRRRAKHVSLTDVTCRWFRSVSGFLAFSHISCQNPELRREL
jgi:hypothetical protein